MVRTGLRLPVQPMKAISAVMLCQSGAWAYLRMDS
jgi:hypothetical protein